MTVSPHLLAFACTNAIDREATLAVIIPHGQRTAGGLYKLRPVEEPVPLGAVLEEMVSGVIVAFDPVDILAFLEATGQIRLLNDRDGFYVGCIGEDVWVDERPKGEN